MQGCKSKVKDNSVNAPYIEDFIKFLHGDVPNGGIHIVPFKAVGRGKKHCDYKLDAAQLQNTELQNNELPEIVSKAANTGAPDCAGECIGRYINIMHDGSVYPCHVLSMPEMYLGNIRDDSLEKIYLKIFEKS